MVRYELGLTTNGGFEVCAFEPYTRDDGTASWAYVLRRLVDSIEDASWLIRMPLREAQMSWLGARP